MRTPALIATLLATFSAAAIPPPPPADLRVSASFDRASIEAGTSGVLRVVISNDGPYDSPDPRATVTFEGLRPLPTSECAVTPATATCRTSSIDAIASRTIEIPVIATGTSQAAAHVTVSGFGNYRNDNDTASATVSLSGTHRQVDAAVRIDADRNEPVPLAPHVRLVTIENKGTRKLTGVVVYIASTPAMSAFVTSAGWECLPAKPVACTYSRPVFSGDVLEVPLELHAAFAGTYEGSVTIASAGGVESNEADNVASFTTTFGVASDFDAVLIPFLGDKLPGAHGSSWTSEVSVRSTIAGVPLLGAPCGTPQMQLTKDTHPLWPVSNCASAPHGVFMYVAKADAEALSFHGLLYEGADFVAELPVVREADFKRVISFPLSALSPILLWHRVSLRVYAIDADAGSMALLDTDPPRFPFGPTPAQPLSQPFTRFSDERVGPGLARHPGYAEFGALDLVQMLREPSVANTLVIYGSGANTRVWAMLVAVDNTTQRPVFITAQ